MMSVSYVKALALILLMSVCSIEALSTNSSRHSQGKMKIGTIVCSVYILL